MEKVKMLLTENDRFALEKRFLPARLSESERAAEVFGPQSALLSAGRFLPVNIFRVSERGKSAGSML